MASRVSDLISKNAYRRPTELAFGDGEMMLDWAGFERRILALGAALRRLGVRPGDRIAYLGLNSIRLVECYYAPSLAGAIISPLNTRHALPELLECAADAEPHVLIADASFVEQAQKIRAGTPSIETVIFADAGAPPEGSLGYEALIEAEGEVDRLALEDCASSGDDVLLLFYTGGTTGRAKGVMLTHTNLIVNAIGGTRFLGFLPGERHLVSGPLFHLAAGSRVYSAAYVESGSVILPRFDPVKVLEAIETHRINSVVLVPTMLKMLLDHPDFARFDLSSLRVLSYGAAPMPPALINRAVAVWPDLQITQSYGQTETSPIITNLAASHHDPAHAGPSKLQSVGRPVDYADVRIMGEDGSFLRPGEVGEVVLRGPQVMKGYWGQPELTAETFRGGFHHTGDAGYLDEDGFLFLSGRTKEMIISGGENVYPIETENVLSTHPAVADCAVIGIPDEKWGEAVHAVLRLREGAVAEEAEIIRYCRERLADYKCPRSVTVWEGEFPLSSVNKVMKSELRDKVLALRG